MARTDTLTNFLTDVADAIRTKTGSAEPISAEDFDTEIENIPSGGGPDWSAIGYSGTPQHVIDTYNEIDNDYNYSKNILDNWDNTETNLSQKYYGNNDLKYMPLVDTSNVTNMYRTFYNCGNLYNVPLLDTSNVTNMSGLFRNTKIKTAPLFNTEKNENFSEMFSNCIYLVDVPIYDTSLVVNNVRKSDMFVNCSALNDNSLDNILQMCINMPLTSSATKTLYSIGIRNATYYPASRIQALPHYQDFIDAGWTIGY